MTAACPWCHRFAGGRAERCLFPQSQQCDSEARREDQAHAINDSYKRGRVHVQWQPKLTVKDAS